MTTKIKEGDMTRNDAAAQKKGNDARVAARKNAKKTSTAAKKAVGVTEIKLPRHNPATKLPHTDSFLKHHARKSKVRTAR